MNMIFLAKGTCTMGMTKRDEDGNITESTQARFEFAPDGPSVAVGEMNSETYEVNSDSVAVFGDWDAAGYLTEVLQLLKPCRSLNIPDFKFLIQEAIRKDNIDFCDYCQNPNCRDCIVKEWKEE